MNFRIHWFFYFVENRKKTSFYKKILIYNALLIDAGKNKSHRSISVKGF